MSESGINNELAARLQSGDEEALVELFSQHRQRLRQMLEFRMDRRLRGREDASDILQDVYIDAHQRIAHYLKSPELSFYIWLRQLTQQRLIDVHRRHLKAEMRDIKQEVPIQAGFSATASSSMAIQLVGRFASPSHVAIRAEMVKQVEEALDAMNPMDREILALRHFEELRNSEVAEVLNIKEAAASNRYIRALSRLRDALQRIPGFFD